MSVSSLLFTLSAHSKDIPLEQLTAPSADKSGVTVHPVLPGEVPDVVTDYLALVGPARHTEPADNDHEVVWLFIGGKGEFSAAGEKFAVYDEVIARAPVGQPTEITVAAGDSLMAIRIRKQLSADDRVEAAKYSQINSTLLFKRFLDCPAYTEAIKSPKTVSRTIMPANMVPRMSVGTVYTTGPDQVGRHKHPMLEQLFIGLGNNDSTVTADDAKTPFPPLSVLHIPLGSMHGTQVAEGKTLYYIWIDFFVTKEGQEWLKTHKPILEYPAPPAAK